MSSINPYNTFCDSNQKFLLQQFASSDNPAAEVALAMLFNSSCSSPPPDSETPFTPFNLTPPSKPLPPLQLFHSSSLSGAQENGAASSSSLELPPAPESSNPFEMQEDGAASSSSLDPKMRKCVNAQREKCAPTTKWYKCSEGWLCRACYRQVLKPGKCANPKCRTETARAWRTNPDDDNTQLCINCYQTTLKPGKCAECPTGSSTRWLKHPKDKTVDICRNCWDKLMYIRGRTS